MTADFLIGAVRASDLHPSVKTELEEILHGPEAVRPVRMIPPIPVRIDFKYQCACQAPVIQGQPFCSRCGKPVAWNEG